MLPAGIGVTEGGLAGLAVAVGGMDGDVALAAALLARVAILGAVVAVGLMTLPVLSRLNDRAPTQRS